MPKRKSQPLLIGITGGIGAGKTLVSRIFELLRIPVFNADEVAKEILASDKEVREKVIEIFGRRAYIGKKPNRKYLAKSIFGNDEMRLKLNHIVHPAVGRAFEQWVEENKNKPYVLKEAAIIFETGGEKNLDAVILVTAPENLRIERVMKRDKVTEKEVRDRMTAQWSDEEKIKRADYHIVNDEKTAIIPQVLKLHDVLINRAGEQHINE